MKKGEVKMKSVNGTKQEQLDELEALRARVSELEARERYSSHGLENYGERTARSFPQAAHMHDAIFVVFDRKFEFVNDRFAELFGVSPEEACSSNFDPMILIAPESRPVIREQYREGCYGAFTKKLFNYIGLSKDGLKIACETFLLFIPYKWGVAVNGTLRCISSLSRRIDEVVPRHHNDLRVAFSTVQTGVPYAERDHRLKQASETFGRFNSLSMEQNPRMRYPIKKTNGMEF
jgi:hypothetical protein